MNKKVNYRNRLVLMAVLATTVLSANLIQRRADAQKNTTTVAKATPEKSVGLKDFLKWENELQKNPKFDLSIIKQNLPFIFADKRNITMYFTNPGHTPGEAKYYVNSQDLIGLTIALAGVADKAAHSHDWVRCHSALKLIMNISLLPIDFTLPDKIMYHGRMIPSSELSMAAWMPAFSSSINVRYVIGEVIKSTKKNNHEDLEVMLKELNYLRDQLNAYQEAAGSISPEQTELTPKQKKANALSGKLVRKVMLQINTQIDKAFDPLTTKK